MNRAKQAASEPPVAPCHGTVQMISVGTAGWSLPRQEQHRFAEGESHLHRYASRFGVTEINSTFYRPHPAHLYARWANAVPATFRFCAKLPRTITHDQRLVNAEALLQRFLEEASPLGPKLACLLVQLPPSLAFDRAVAADFLECLREHWPARVALEPRHASWFEPDADALMRDFRVARVLADPVRYATGRAPGGWPGLVYVRLHGSPCMYYSAYESSVMEALAQRLRRAEAECDEAWCIFDNTASGAAVTNGLQLVEALT
jgi:uncharacterized protein YecE (DUF72 family)